MSLEIIEGVKMIRRGVQRACPGTHKMLPLTCTMLDQIISMKLSLFERFVCNLMVIGYSFLLRSDELLALEGICFCSSTCKCSSHIRLYGSALELSLVEFKTMITNDRVPRRLDCICASISLDGKVACPVCAMYYLFSLKLLAIDNSDWMPSMGKKPKPLEYPTFSKLFVGLIKKTGVVVVEKKKNLYGTQSMRRGGCQALYHSSWSISGIALFGRWSEASVMVYLQDLPISSLDPLLVCKDICSIRNVNKSNPNLKLDKSSRAYFKKGSTILVASSFEEETIWLSYEVEKQSKDPKKVRVKSKKRIANGSFTNESVVLDLSEKDWVVR